MAHPSDPAGNQDIDPEFYLEKHEGDDYLRALYELHGERFAAYRRDWDRASRMEYVPEYPLYIQFELTNYCNLHCKMCHFASYSHEAQHKKHLDLALFTRVLEECRGLVPSAMIGSASECLLHPEIETIIHRLGAGGFLDTIIHTNGVLLTDRIIDAILASGISRLNVSLDAATPETYRRIRGGSLEKVERNIRRFLEKRAQRGGRLPYLRVTFVKLDDNMHEYDMFLDKWSGVADRVDFQAYSPLCGEDEETPLCAADVQHDCSLPYRLLSFDYDGNAYPCCSYYMKFLGMGSVVDTPVATIWRSAPMEALRRSLRERTFLKPCVKCLSTWKA
ncbi:radical SAM protein [Solidesulfovibrio sp.]|uniref:radical SAM/SPASM domain-containing protein n=1 Tax=Solidesulfovibrio sp. TaxID=2910990 RepID=UPI002B203396|nr:radical SAM protein [Solidesulfovibrio sp.]MEA5090923.1 radical SAM protein [Solidesulfovibrio sp.]